MNYTEFTVTGSGSFPIDMLRYDSCWPAREAEAGAIERSFRPRERAARYSVRLRTIDPTAPTVARWRSFGFNVAES